MSSPSTPAPAVDDRATADATQAGALVTGLLLPALILTVAAGLRFYAIGRSSFWSDEGNTWALVQRGWGEIAAAAAADIHPPGYYWLLKGWSATVGTSDVALRSFSAVCGVLLVALILPLGRQVAAQSNVGARTWLPLSAGWVAALLPFQIYYSHEARMYMLLAVWGALLFLLLLRLLPPEPLRLGRLLAYALVAAAGLWTHYSFPILIAAAGLTWLLAWLRARPIQWRALAGFAAANALALLAFAPWLPTAWRQITTWPQGGESVGLAEGGRLVLQTMLFGLLRTLPEPTWPWLAAAALLPVAGAVMLRRSRALPALLFWLGAPLALMAGLGLFSDAFLKFLLVASAPWCLLVAAAAEGGPLRLRPWTRGALAGGMVALALFTLPAYWADSSARDNYRGVAAWLAATADPAHDIVILNAPGQADVWRLYDPGLPVFALPAERPPTPAAVAQALESATTGKRAVYALLWATDESDPDALVEGWLNQHLYRGAESWQGNVRFAQYRSAPQMEPIDLPAGAGPLRLVAASLPVARSVAAGEPLPVALSWQALEQPGTELAASLQLLDARGQVVAQVDGPPGGAPPPSWADGAAVVERRAVVIPAGTPPGEYRLIAVLYDPATGERLPLGQEEESVALGTVQVQRPARPLPAALLPMAHPVGRSLGPVRLLGYTQHKAGFAHAPTTPVAEGDRLHVTLFWQAPPLLPADWPADATFTLRLGDQSVTLALGGGAYPTSQWQAGEIVRTEVEIPVTAAGASARPQIEVGDTPLRLAPLPR